MRDVFFSVARYAGGAPGAVVGPGEDREETCDRRQGDVTLGAVDEVVAVGELARAGLQCRRIGTGRFFRQGETADQLARGKAGQVALLLIGRAVPDQAFRSDAGVLRSHDAIGHRALGQFHEGQGQFFGRQFTAAIDLRDAPAEGAELSHRRDEVFADAVLALDAVLVGNGNFPHEAPGARQEIVEPGLVVDHVTLYVRSRRQGDLGAGGRA